MGFPTLKSLTEALKGNDQVIFLAVQTVFEGYHTNTQDKLRQNQINYKLSIPMAHAPGNPETRRPPDIMGDYRSGGTPWTVIIDTTGKVAYNAFHIEVNKALDLLKRLSKDATK